MKKTAFIWRESIYKAAVDGVYRCNQCKCKIFDANTGELHANQAIGVPYLFCADCNNVVAKVKEIESDGRKESRRGLWKE